MGGAARTQQASIEHVLVNNIKFKDRRMTALWHLMPEEAQLDTIRQIAKTINQAGFLLVPIGDTPTGQLSLGSGAQDLGEPPGLGEY